MNININSFTAMFDGAYIFHYDVVITPEKNAAAMNKRLMKELQNNVAPAVFADAGVAFDGRKNLVSSAQLNMRGDSAEFDVTLPGEAPTHVDRPPRIYKIRLTLVATINAELLRGFTAGQQSHDNVITTALMALNLVIKEDPSQKFPTKGRSFFTPEGSKKIMGGLELWRGYFQSMRPAVGRLLVNVDISTGLMYQAGPLIGLCLEFLKIKNPAQLSSQMPDHLRRDLGRFITGVRVQTRDAAGGAVRSRVVRKLSRQGASEVTFQDRDGHVRTVARYFQDASGRPLRYPALLCVEVGRGALIPLELCTVIPGQIVRKEIPEEVRSALVEFSTMHPKQRLESVRQALRVLAYGQSEYVRKFGLAVGTDLVSTQARVLNAPRLKYGGTGPKATVNPANGSWNMADKRFFQPMTIKAWVLAILEAPNRFNDQVAQNVARDLVAGCRATGMTVEDPNPVIRRINGQGNIAQQLLAAGKECADTKVGPSLFVVVLPEGGNHLYTIVKHWGDIRQGVATQCLKSRKCTGAKMQYWANVALKINVKLGGVNVITDATQMTTLSDPHLPTVIMGADVMHPAPGSTGRPSFAAVVSSVDANAAKYVAISKVQVGRQELITDLQEMTSYALSKYLSYREFVEKAKPVAPKRLIFYRDGVSEGQFQQVLDQELPLIKAACREHKINPTITLIVVGKRHHIRLFAANDKDADRSGNCPAGTVVDRDIGHPTEFDFYLQSHGGLLGTSRPAHYSVLYDDNKLSADALQALSFALCHVYARATRSVSIPAPVYYADTVCARAKIHFDPFAAHSETGTTTSDASENLESFKRDYLPLHDKHRNLMYFS